MKNIYKGWELIKAINNKEIKEGTYIDVHDSGGCGEKIATILYTNEKLNWETGSFTTAYLCSKRYTFIVSEEQQDIDIQDIKEFIIPRIAKSEEADMWTNRIRINELIRAVKQLDRREER